MEYENIKKKVETLHLNKNILKANGVSNENIYLMEYWYVKLKNIFYEAQILYNNKSKIPQNIFLEEAERIGREVEIIEKNLQKLWNFEENDVFFRYWFKLPICECPKADNEEGWGFKRIINCECPVHGYMCKKANKKENKMKYVVYIIELNLGQEHYYGEPSSDIIEAKGSREFFDNYKEAFDFFVSYSYGKCGDRFALPPVAVPNVNEKGE